MSESAKIEFYYQEGKKIWPDFSQKAIEKPFFELWELIQKPMPFQIDKSRPLIHCVNQTINLPCHDGEMTGYYGWDDSNNCAALFVETPDWHQEWLLAFCDGDPQIYEQPMVNTGSDGISHGEKMEILYDLISCLQQHAPHTKLLDLSRKDMIPWLDMIAANHSRNTINLIKKLPAESIKKLLKKAIEDMAADEISSQLELPLSGNYAVNTPVEQETHNIIGRLAPATIYSKTRWEITAELNFILNGCRLLAENEKDFLLPLNKAEVIAVASNSVITLKIRLDYEFQLTQGDVLNTFLTDEKELFGTFTIDIFDGMTIYGRLHADVAGDIENFLPRLFLRLPPGTTEFIAAEIEHLITEIENNADFKESALEHILGFSQFKFLPGDTNIDLTIDASQKQACAAAFNQSNPVVVIQGPPGTGKTFILEQIARELCRLGLRILITAPSNTAIDNICRRIIDLPLLRLGKHEPSIARDIADKCWIYNPSNVDHFIANREKLKSGGIYAGTHLGLLRDEIVNDDMKQNGTYDVIIFDEAGMANTAEFLLCARYGKRVIALGDHRQLPPFPMPLNVKEQLLETYEAVPHKFSVLIDGSAMEWLADFRLIPVIMLKYSYRCQNPRLLRFASTLFYDAGIRASYNAEYYLLGYQERQHKFPPSTLCFYTTSELREKIRKEELFLEGQKPGLANPTEVAVCCYIFYQAVQKYPLEEISIIVPYRKQVNLIRNNLSIERVRALIPRENISEERWKLFLSSRVATVDSFQGGESDLVIISYVRSNENEGIGFTDNHNRINVAHTRCRRELHIVGDLECLKRQATSNIFQRMEKAFRRDGMIVNVNETMLNRQ